MIVAYGALTLWDTGRRLAADLESESMLTLVIRFALVAVGDDRRRRRPQLRPRRAARLLILVGFVVGMEYLAKQTRFGRHVFAVGGNVEAARRAGIGIEKIRIIVFAMSGTMAAIGGIMAASRLLAVNQNSGGSELLLLAIAGPVIAGTSLFGGRGAVWTALVGALVIGSISNGMDLLALSSAVKFMVTGGVLLLAVIVDAIARQQRQAAGRV